LEHRVLATPAAPNFEPPPPQVADRRAKDRRGTVGQLRQGSPARRRHGPPDYVQACGAQLIDQVLGAHSGEVEVSRPWQASATHNRLSEHCGDLLVRQGDRRKFGGQAAIACGCGRVSLAGWNLCP
jgi:hypothetical protein